MSLFHNPFAKLKPSAWVLYLLSLTVVTASAFLGGTADALSLICSLIGVTALIFLAGGDVWGQILTCVFAVLYAIVSFRLSYYSEVITYLGLSAPSALFSVFAWLRHPSAENRDVVNVHTLRAAEVAGIFGATAAVTVGGFFLLRALGTPQLAVSVISVATSFLAAALMFFRSPYYALAYAANDVVLIILWTVASVSDLRYLAVVACFVAFLANDLYAFLCWRTRERVSRAQK